MALNTSAIGKTWPAVDFEVDAERVRQYAEAVGETNPVHDDREAATAAGFRDLVAPPMFCVVYSAPAMGPAITDPNVEMNLMAMVHGGQEFAWGEPVCAGCASVRRCGRRRRHRLASPLVHALQHTGRIARSAHRRRGHGAGAPRATR